MIGKSRAKANPGQDCEDLRRYAALALAGQAVQFETNDLVDGKVHRFEHRLNPDVDATGQVQGFFVSAMDITERSAAEQAHREIAAFFEHTTAYMLQYDARGQGLYVNPALRRALAIDEMDRMGDLHLVHL